MAVMSDDPILSRDELVNLVAKAHGASSSYSDSSLAGRSLAAQSKLPKLVATNLGAGLGQWDFFPEAKDIVDFAFAYVPPATEEDALAMARTWAADDAAGRQTLMALVGRDILQHELRRIDAPKLRELFDETNPARVHELRASLGLPVASAALASAAPAAAPAKRATSPKRAAAPKREIPTRMPKPEFRRPPPKVAPPPPKRFSHPKFGEGVLETRSGEGPDAKLTIKFEGGSKTLVARFVTELPSP